MVEGMALPLPLFNRLGYFLGPAKSSPWKITSSALFFLRFSVEEMKKVSLESVGARLRSTLRLAFLEGGLTLLPLLLPLLLLLPALEKVVLVLSRPKRVSSNLGPRQLGRRGGGLGGGREPGEEEETITASPSESSSIVAGDEGPCFCC